MQIASVTIETNPSLIPKDIHGVGQKYKLFKDEMRNCGFSTDYGVRQFKCAVIMCIGNQIQLAAPNLYDESKFRFTDSTSTDGIRSKLDYCLSLYSLAEPLIRQYIIYG